MVANVIKLHAMKYVSDGVYNEIALCTLFSKFGSGR